MSSEERARKEVGRQGNEDVDMDVWRHKEEQVRNERIRGTRKVGEISKKV